MKDSIAARRAVFNSVVRAVAEQLPFEGGQQFNVTTREAAWKIFMRDHFCAGCSSEEVIQREDWHQTVLAMEAWGAGMGVTFDNREDKA